MQLGNFKPQKPSLSFSDLDSAYQNHFIRELLLTFAGFILGIIFAVFMKKWLYILIVFLAAFSYALYVVWQIYKSLCNKILVIDAKCIDLVRKETKLLGAASKDMSTSKTCTLILENEDGTKLKQSVAFSSDYKTGDTVRIYADEGTISQLNQNTFTVINPIFMHVLKT